MQDVLWKGLGLCLIFCGLSCSRSEPKIAYGAIRLVYYGGSGGADPRFSFFILPEDDDGIDDLDELYLYHDLEGLVWRLSADDWVRYEFDEKIWIGSHGIAMREGESLPQGQFRVVLIDKGGERSEVFLAFDAPANPRRPFPVFSIEDGNYRIESQYPEHYLICYDGAGAYIQTIPVTARNAPVASLNLPSNIRGAALWAEDGEYYTAAVTDILPLR
ncbi:MAG: hypothetical protein LBD37_06140 [Treponema sp.]|nr:hypothetical protein [Treponema sp.]